LIDELIAYPAHPEALGHNEKIILFRASQLFDDLLVKR
jgi:hypothetical protein